MADIGVDLAPNLFTSENLQPTMPSPYTLDQTRDHQQGVGKMHSGSANRVSRRDVLGRVGGAAALAAVSVMLQACSSGPPATATTKPAGSSQPTPAATKATTSAQPTAASTVAASTNPSTKQTQFTFTARIGVQADHYDAFGKLFMQAHPNIKYVPHHVPSAQWSEKIQIQAAGGSLADAIWMPSIGMFGEFSHKGLIVPLDEMVKGQNVDLTVYYKSAIGALTRQGKLFGIPWICHPGRTGLYYSKALFDAAQVKYPGDAWTYEDLATAAHSLTKSDGGKTSQFGYLPGTDIWSYIEGPIRAFGADYLSPDGTKSTIDAPAAISSIQEGLANPIGKDKVSPTPDAVEGGSAQMFVSKKLATFQSGYWGMSSLYQLAKDLPWAVAPMPLQQGGKMGMFEVDTNVVTKFAKDPTAAFMFCLFMGSKDAGIDIAKRGSVPGARPDVWNAPELTSNPNHVVFSKMMAEAAPLLLPANFRENELGDAFQKGFDPINTGKETDAAALIKGLNPTLQAILDKPPA